MLVKSPSAICLGDKHKFPLIFFNANLLSIVTKFLKTILIKELRLCLSVYRLRSMEMVKTRALKFGIQIRLGVGVGPYAH